MYIVVAVGICVGVNFSGLSLKIILAINGTVFGFLFIYFLPVALHVKCVFYTSSGSPEIELVAVNNAQIVANVPTKYSHFTNEKK